MTTPLLELRHVTRFFPSVGRRPSVLAVDAVNLKIGRGETVAIVGPSGAGKSTLLRIALALDPPSSGSVLFDGHDLWRLDRESRRRLRRRFQPVFQDPYGALDPHLCVWRTVTEPLRAHGLVSRANAPARAAALLTTVGLDPALGNHSPGNLSGGERQRVAIARALGPEPDLLLLDEPVTALDAIVRGEILTLVKDHAERLGFAILLISHDPAAARLVCHRTVVMDHGQIVDDRPTEDVLSLPMSVAGAPIVNTSHPI